MAAAAAANSYFERLENVTPDRVHELFLRGHSPAYFKSDTPVFIFLIGAPGVGKTSQAERLLTKQVYDHLYTISLDTIVEHIRPFRNTTLKLYNNLASTREVTNNNYAKMSALYLRAIETNDTTFELPEQNRQQRIKLGLAPSLSPTMNDSKKKKPTKNDSSIASITSALASMQINERPRTNGKKGMEYYCTPCKIWHKQKITVEKHVSQKGGSLRTQMIDTIHYAIMQSYNILYDTTLNGTTDKVDPIMTIIHEKNKELRAAGKQPYSVRMIHVTASAERIQERLRQRHHKMITKGYLRAIYPGSTKLLQKFIDNNHKGFEATQKKYPEIDCIPLDNDKQIRFEESSKDSTEESPTRSSPKKRRGSHHSSSSKSPRKSVTQKSPRGMKPDAASP